MQTITKLSTVIKWLDRMNVEFYQCDQCSALHLSYLQKIEGVNEAKIELIDDILVISITAVIKQSAITALHSELSQINQSLFFPKVYLDINDTSDPTILFCYSMHLVDRPSFNQFSLTLTSVGEESIQVISELYHSDLLNTKNDITESVYQQTSQVFH